MKKKEILIPMRYTGKIPCEIVGLGKFKPDEKRDIPESFARNLQHDRNWKLLGPIGDSRKRPNEEKSQGIEKDKGGK